MINEELEIFLKFDLQRRFQEEFYGELIEYFKFIIPILKKGNHTIDNEMECVGSQYLHLYYVPTKEEDSIFVVYRNEQHSDTIFYITMIESMPYYSINVFKGSDDLKELLQEKINKKKEIKFKTIDDFKNFVRWNQESMSEQSLTTDEILSGKKAEAVFQLSKMKDRLFVMDSPYYSFQEQLKIFDLMNCMVCGVASDSNVKIPKKFMDGMKKASEFSKKLKDALPKEKY